MSGRAVIYLRVSTDEQAEHGDGLNVQHDACAARAAAFELEVEGEYIDAGVSGGDPVAERTGLATLMARLGEPALGGIVDAVIVAKLDRLARDLMMQEAILADLWKRGVQVISCSEAETMVLRPDDPADPARRLIRQILGAVAEYERALIRARMVAGRRRKLAHGGFGGGPVSYGWRLVDGGLVERPEEAAVVRDMARFRALGFSFDAIADQLNLSGFTNRGGRAWTSGSVGRALAAWERLASG